MTQMEPDYMRPMVAAFCSESSFSTTFPDYTLHRQTSNGSVHPTSADRRRALDEMVIVLLGAGGDAMMDQPNSAGETPRQLQSKN